MATELTPEQLEQERAISFQFLQRHPYFKTCKHNADLFAKFLETYHLPFSLEALERGFDELGDQFIYLTPEEMKAESAAALEKDDNRPPKHPWGDKLTNVIVAKMDRADFKKYLANPEFRKQLNDLGIKS